MLGKVHRDIAIELALVRAQPARELGAHEGQGGAGGGLEGSPLTEPKLGKALDQQAIRRDGEEEGLLPGTYAAFASAA